MKMPRNTPNNVLQENFLDIKKESIKSQSMELKVILDDKKKPVFDCQNNCENGHTTKINVQI